MTNYTKSELNRAIIAYQDINKTTVSKIWSSNNINTMSDASESIILNDLRIGLYELACVIDWYEQHKNDIRLSQPKVVMIEGKNIELMRGMYYLQS